MRRTNPSARQTRQPDLRQSIRLMQSATSSASHTGANASQGLSSMQHPAWLPVSWPPWMTYRIGLAMARRGHLTLATSRPVERAYKLTLAHGYNFTGWLSVVNFWIWLVGLPTYGEVPEENLLHFFWHWSAGLSEICCR